MYFTFESNKNKIKITKRIKSDDELKPIFIGKLQTNKQTKTVLVPKSYINLRKSIINYIQNQTKKLRKIIIHNYRKKSNVAVSKVYLTETKTMSNEPKKKY